MPQFQFTPPPPVDASLGSRLMLAKGAAQADAVREGAYGRGAMVSNVGNAVAGSIGDIMAGRQAQKQQQAQHATQDAIAQVLQSALGPNGLYDPQKVSAAAQQAGLAHEVQPLIDWVDKHNTAAMSQKKTAADLQPKPEVPPRTRQVEITNPDGSKSIKIVEDTPGQTFTSAPVPAKPEKPPTPPAVGSFEDYVVQRFGARPTPAQITQARKDYSQADDKAAGDVTKLTPEGLDAAAMMFAKTGQLPALGMGDKTTRQQIINRAAALIPGLDVATAKADFGANSDSLKAIQKQRDALGAFEATALKNLDVFLEAAKKVPDTGSPLLNRPIRLINEKMLGGEALTAFNTARRTVIPEFAKILANPGLSGQLSDSARHEIEAVVSGDATLKQTIAAATILKTDTANRRQSYDDQIAAIQSRIKLGSQPAAGAGVSVTAPNGKVYPFPDQAAADRFVADAKAKGLWK